MEPIKPTPEELMALWRTNGAKYGYPSCCIEDFVQFAASGMWKTKGFRGRRILDGTGFVPCLTCHTTKTEDQLVTEITANRAADLPPFTKEKNRAAYKSQRRARPHVREGAQEVQRR